MPGRTDNLIVGLSIGTTKTTMIVAERDRRYPDSINVIGFGDAASRGISKGIIVSQDARQSVEAALADAQSITGISAKRLKKNVIVAFDAMEVQTESTHGMITLGGRESKSVEESDLDRVIERAVANSVLATASRNNMYSLHMIPTSYELDGRPIDEPLNMNGSQLDIWLQTVAVPLTNAQNVVNCVQSAGIEVRGLLLKPLASALGALYEEEMRAGCISVCIGGGTTGVVLYRNGRAFRIMSIPIGGDHIRNDLATILRMTLGDAEYLKKRIFTTSEEDLKREGIDVDLAYQTVLARIEELFGDHLRAALSECTPQNFPSGIILSGGVSETPGIDRILHDILMMPVRKVVQPVYKMPPRLDNAAYVSSAGILRYYATIERDPYAFMESGQELPGLGVPKARSKRDEGEFDIEPLDSEEVEEEVEDEEEEQYERGRANRENFGQVVKTIADRIKHLF